MSLKNALRLSVFLRICIVILGMGLVLFKGVKSKDQTVSLFIPSMLDAASSGKYDVIARLLKNGETPNIVDDAGSSASSLVGAVPQVLMNVGNSALAFCVFNGVYPANQHCIDLLLQHQGNPRLKNKAGQPPFFWVVKIDYKDLRMKTLGKLIKFGGDINAKDNKGFSLLEKVVETYDTIGVDMVLDWWAKLINKDVLASAKERAVGYNLTDVLVILNKKRAFKPVQDAHWNPSAIDTRTGMNDLHYATISNDKNLVEACLAQGANINKASEDEFGMRPLHYAVLHYHPTMVSFLIGKGADVTRSNLYSNTPLHMVAWIDSLSIAQQMIDALVKSGANLNARNKDGNTLLHMLVYNNKKEVIEYLCGKYTNYSIDLRNSDRESVVDLATRLDRKYLLNYMKKK